MTTPQKLAQDVAARAAAMAQKTNMRLLGVVENMSGDVFGSGGGEELAGELGVPLLGTVPLDPALREQGDAGAPIISAEPQAASARAIVAIAQEIEALRHERGGDRQVPAARRMSHDARDSSRRPTASRAAATIASCASWSRTTQRGTRHVRGPGIPAATAT